MVYIYDTYIIVYTYTHTHTYTLFNFFKFQDIGISQYV